MNENKEIGNVLPPNGNAVPQNNNLVGQTLGNIAPEAQVTPVNKEDITNTVVLPNMAQSVKPESVTQAPKSVIPPVAPTVAAPTVAAPQENTPSISNGIASETVAPRPAVDSIPPVPVASSIPDKPEVVNLSSNVQGETNKVEPAAQVNVPPVVPASPEVSAVPPTMSPVSNTISAGMDPVSSNGNAYKATPIVPPVPGAGIIDKENILMPNQESVGIIPPEKKEKKKMNRILFFFLIILLIGLIAFSLYYFLSNSALFSTPSTKDLVLEIYDELPTSITELVDLNGTSESSCTLDLSNVKTTSVGSYVYSVTCDEFFGEGTITIVDASVLEASGTTVDLIKGTSDYSADMFIDSCSKENCYYEFADADLVEEYLSGTGASNLVEIIVSDDAGTLVTVESYLNVAIAYLDSTSQTFESSVYDASYSITDRLLIGTGNLFIGVAYRYTTYIFNTLEEYNSFVNISYETDASESTIEVVSAQEDTLTVVLKENLDNEQLTSEYGSDFPEDYSSIKSYYTASDYTVVVTTD